MADSPLTFGLLISMVGLVIVIGVHIAVIARWSGKIDAFFISLTNRIDQHDREIEKLRIARHEQDGVLSFHHGVLLQAFPELDRRMSEVDRLSIKKGA